jgi:hypothetical protein
MKAAGVRSFKTERDDPMSTAADSSSFATGSKKSYDVSFLLSIAIVVIGTAVAVWALPATHHDFSPGELGLMAVPP